jgi:hypothetical protein
MLKKNTWNKLANIATVIMGICGVAALIISLISILQSCSADESAAKSNNLALKANLIADDANKSSKESNKKANTIAEETNTNLNYLNLKMSDLNTKIDDLVDSINGTNVFFNKQIEVLSQQVQNEVSTSLPSVEAIIRTNRDENGKVITETLSVYNGAQPLKNFECNIHTIILINAYYCINMQFMSSDNQVDSMYLYTPAYVVYLPVYDYFPSENGEYLESSVGPLYTNSSEGNFSNYEKLENKFVTQGTEIGWVTTDNFGNIDSDGYYFSFRKIHIIEITYDDMFDTHNSEVLIIKDIKSKPMGSQDFSATINYSVECQNKAKENGLPLTIKELIGLSLWKYLYLLTTY